MVVELTVDEIESVLTWLENDLTGYEYKLNNLKTNKSFNDLDRDLFNIQVERFQERISAKKSRIQMFEDYKEELLLIK